MKRRRVDVDRSPAVEERRAIEEQIPLPVASHRQASACLPAKRSGRDNRLPAIAHVERIVPIDKAWPLDRHPIGTPEPSHQTVANLERRRQQLVQSETHREDVALTMAASLPRNDVGTRRDRLPHPLAFERHLGDLQPSALCLRGDPQPSLADEAVHVGIERHRVPVRQPVGDVRQRQAPRHALAGPQAHRLPVPEAQGIKIGDERLQGHPAPGIGRDRQHHPPDSGASPVVGRYVAHQPARKAVAHLHPQCVIVAVFPWQERHAHRLRAPRCLPRRRHEQRLTSDPGGP